MLMQMMTKRQEGRRRCRIEAGWSDTYFRTRLLCDGVMVGWFIKGDAVIVETPFCGLLDMMSDCIAMMLLRFGCLID